MDYLIARLKEASTYAGIAVVAEALGQAFQEFAYVGHGIAVVCGAFAFFLKEGSFPPAQRGPTDDVANSLNKKEADLNEGR